MTDSVLEADANNRALRTFLQGLGIDVAVGVAALVLSGAVDAISDTAGLIAFGVAVGKTVATSMAAYVMRRWLDRSSFPTPLPPV
jgi:hypothetical protein